MLSKTSMLLMMLATGNSQTFQYSVSSAHPFETLNPETPEHMHVFAPLIGQSNCLSRKRIDQNNWAPVQSMQWVFRYIMNGTAVQDESLAADGSYGGSIRLYDVKNQTWQVHYYNNQVMPLQLPTWQGGLDQNRLVFHRPQQAPNGMSGHYRLTFHDITESGFEWRGDWVSEDESIIYPTWKISCQKS